MHQPKTAVCSQVLISQITLYFMLFHTYLTSDVSKSGLSGYLTNPLYRGTIVYIVKMVKHMKNDLTSDVYDFSYLSIRDCHIYIKIPVERNKAVTYINASVPIRSFEEAYTEAEKLRSELYLKHNGTPYIKHNYWLHRFKSANNKSGKLRVSPQITINKQSVCYGYIASLRAEGDGKRKRVFCSFTGSPIEAFLEAARMVDESFGITDVPDQEYLKVYNPIDWKHMVEEKRKKLPQQSEQNATKRTSK